MRARQNWGDQIASVQCVCLVRARQTQPFQTPDLQPKHKLIRNSKVAVMIHVTLAFSTKTCSTEEEPPTKMGMLSLTLSGRHCMSLWDAAIICVHLVRYS